MARGPRRALTALDRRPRAPAHVLLESYSVLTRLPPPNRTSPAIAVTFLKGRFLDPPLALQPDDHARLVELVARYGLAGGSVYDALIAWTVKLAGATLLTRDSRAIRVYQTVDVPFELLV
ncbi:MAG: PIN domain-containing protein [Acidobacteria bacterium]|nr:PIN domain-containing protein [Acidobacteriota bacterium]